MKTRKNTIAIITARGGSKGLPGKNIKLFCGKPLIAWSIEAGLKSSYIDELIVSTDCQEIATIAKKYGAKVPFVRPSELADDFTSSIDVIKHALNFYKLNLGKSFKYAVLLEPTSPLREWHDIDLCFKQLLENKRATALVGICKTESQNPVFLTKKDRNNFLTGYLSESISVMRRQEIDDIFFFEGSIYISETESLLKNGSFYHAKTLGYEFPKWKSIEIDDQYDFIMAEALMRYKGLCK